MKQRNGPHGIHLFDRRSGLNILLDEGAPDPCSWSRAPRQVSMALHNLCDLHCAYCYAPKHRASLPIAHVLQWLQELDREGCLGVGFGGGEPTLFPGFSELCQEAAVQTGLAITFTTHGHRLDQDLLDRMRGAVHFVRVSVDGVGAVYEQQRGHKFSSLRQNLEQLAAHLPFGINVVVNDRTAAQLDDLAELAQQFGARELLLLPQQATTNVEGLKEPTSALLQQWVHGYRGPVPLAVSEAGADGLPTCEPLPLEKGLGAYAHIDASGKLRASSYAPAAVEIGSRGVMQALERLRRTWTIEQETAT